MADPINGLGSLSIRGVANNPPLSPLNSPPAEAGSVNFQNVLLKSVEQLNQLDQQAQEAIEVGLTNGDLTQAEIFTAMKKADLAYRTMLQIRNKVIDAYKEIQQLRM